jgi:hypothetical protein
MIPYRRGTRNMVIGRHWHISIDGQPAWLSAEIVAPQGTGYDSIATMYAYRLKAATGTPSE